MATCRICGDEVREGDDLVLVDDVAVHRGCVEAPATRMPRRTGAWAAFGSRGQMAMGDVQRDNPV